MQQVGILTFLLSCLVLSSLSLSTSSLVVSQSQYILFSCFPPCSHVGLQGVSVGQWLVSFKDPFTVAVVFEDGAAVSGVAIAALGIGLTQVTGLFNDFLRVDTPLHLAASSLLQHMLRCPSMSISHTRACRRQAIQCTTALQHSASEVSSAQSRSSSSNLIEASSWDG